jgi:hypothetical protein
MDDNKIHDVIRTKKLELIDSEERVRVRLEEHDKGFIGMRFFDLSGHLKMNIGLGADGVPNVSLSCGDGHPRIVMTALNDGSSQIFAYTGSPEAVKGNEVPCWQLYIAGDGSVSKITYFTTDGTPALVIGANSKGDTTLSAFKDGQIIWVAPNDCRDSKPKL